MPRAWPWRSQQAPAFLETGAFDVWPENLYNSGRDYPGLWKVGLGLGLGLAPVTQSDADGYSVLYLR